MCKLNLGQLCKEDDCQIYKEKCFIFFDGKTKSGIKKVDCWDYKSNELKPEDVVMRTNRKFNFICPDCKHLFSLGLSDITRDTDKYERWCPYCSKRNSKLCQDKNCKICYEKSFASYEGKTDKNIKKIDCWASFSAKAFNISRETTGTWCPKCINKTEEKFENWLIKNFGNLDYIRQHKYEWCKNKETNRYLPFDFVIEEYNLIIEIDGEHHFKQIGKWRNPKDTRIVDIYKMKKAFDNDYSIIRIMAMDIMCNINGWEKNIRKYIKKHDKPVVKFIGDKQKYNKYIVQMKEMINK